MTSQVHSLRSWDMMAAHYNSVQTLPMTVLSLAVFTDSSILLPTFTATQNHPLKWLPVWETNLIRLQPLFVIFSSNNSILCSYHGDKLFLLIYQSMVTTYSWTMVWMETLMWSMMEVQTQWCSSIKLSNWWLADHIGSKFMQLTRTDLVMRAQSQPSFPALLPQEWLCLPLNKWIKLLSRYLGALQIRTMAVRCWAMQSTEMMALQQDKSISLLMLLKLPTNQISSCTK